MRKTIISILVAFAMTANADDLKWAMKTSTGQTVFMSNVGYLLYADGATTFSVVCKDNTTIPDVRKVTFEKVADTAVETIGTANGIGLLAHAVDRQLVIMGCRQGLRVAVYSPSGALLRQLTTEQEQTVVDVSDLPEGAYILRVADTAVKFLKQQK